MIKNYILNLRENGIKMSRTKVEACMADMKCTLKHLEGSTSAK